MKVVAQGQPSRTTRRQGLVWVTLILSAVNAIVSVRQGNWDAAAGWAAAFFSVLQLVDK